MSKIEAGLLYTKEDEWIKVDGDEATVGVSDHAQDALSDIVYLELPDVGDAFGMGDTFGVVESVKAAADLYMPVSGEVTAVNEDLIDTPELVNSDPYGAAWMVKIKLSNPSELDDLMDAATYTQYLEERD
ncbi:MAG: glycine cleavage system protein GcvH [Ardenticatenaceae bacterium]|nr:glycine cleavage system protein GcvH [Ardenticatenaceae bacterium]MCB9444323.1 glycine cleavage system protein GcvH [Ardenticatenaceae bacterium]MCB9446033.1 glycine cleavage system protein GcvH [Ardenticatenaceae bacterium]